ncbi:hypothetical protein HZ994_02220 [Akkermansiaceae bacterium]|nr:hypothetical protein HZ994_02220 [Akkermansiaceae bacterium]
MKILPVAPVLLCAIISFPLFPTGALAAGTTPSWQEIGPLNMPSFEPSQGRVNAVAFDPGNANRFFVGAATGGVWRTTDGGANYTPVSDNLPNPGVSSLVVDYSNANRIYLATGDADGSAVYSIGVWKSDDGGGTWVATGLTFPATGFTRIYKLIQHPTAPNTLFAATSAGLYTTANGGTTWTNSLSAYKLYDLEFKPGTPSVFYACGSDAGGGRFLRSTDTGATWSVIATGLPASTGVGRCAIAPTSAAPGTIYFLSSGTSSYYGLWRSQDSGLSFSQMSGSGASNVFSGVSSYKCTLTVAPDAADEVYVAGTTPFKSEDGGSTWTEIRNDAAFAMVCHVDFHAMEWRGADLYVGTDGGLHRTANRGINWTDLSARLGIAQIYAFGQTEATAALVYTGQQDDGLNRWNGSSWAHVQVGDWGRSVIHPFQASIGYAFVQSSLRKTTDGWSSSQALTITSTESGPFVNTSLVMDPLVPETLYAGLQNVWKTTDEGVTWSKVSTFGSGTVSSLAVASSNPKYIYASTSTGDLWVTQNGGVSWTNTRAHGLPSSGGRALRQIAISPVDPSTAYLSTDGYGTGPRIYRTTSAGGTWSDYSGSLPAVPVRSVAAADGNKAGVYAGTSLGVYYRSSLLSDWIPFNTGMPNTFISDLQIHRGSQKLRAGTYGRGLWESSIVEVPPIVTTGNVMSFIAAASENCDSLASVTASVSDGYSVVDTTIFDSATASFHLAHASYAPQSIALNAEYVPTATSNLQFRSRLGLATPTQIIHVQASTDGGVSWTDIYTQSGSGTSGESSFNTRNVSLAAYEGSVIRLRFTYSVSGSYYPQTSNGIGWHFDSVSFTDTSQITATNPSATVVNGSVNPNGMASTAWFEFGTTRSYDTRSAIRNIGSAASAAPITETLTGLLPDTTYHYRVVSVNPDGTSQGQDRTFVTGGATAFYVWASANGVSNDPNAIGANGIKNLLNFAFGVDPVNGDGGGLEYTGTFAGGGTIKATGQPITLYAGADFRTIFVRRKDYNVAGLTYTVQFSANLSMWEDGGVPTVLADNGIYEIVSIGYPPLVDGLPPHFFRLKVSVTP